MQHGDGRTNRFGRAPRRSSRHYRLSPSLCCEVAVVANRGPEGDADDCRSAETRQNLRHVDEGLGVHDHRQDQDRVKRAVLEVAVLGQRTLLDSMMVIERTYIAPMPMPIATTKRFCVSAKAPITPSNEKLASSTSR